jgi:hypothetical protein
MFAHRKLVIWLEAICNCPQLGAASTYADPACSSITTLAAAVSDGGCARAFFRRVSFFPTAQDVGVVSNRRSQVIHPQLFMFFCEDQRERSKGSL